MAPAVVAEFQSILSIVGACDKEVEQKKRPSQAWASVNRFQALLLVGAWIIGPRFLHNKVVRGHEIELG